MDLDPTVDFSNRPRESRTHLLKILDQFAEVQSRWRNWFEERTLLLIAHCARYQRHILAQTEDIPADNKINRSTLVAALLRCLVITHQINEVDSNLGCFDTIRNSGLDVIRDEGFEDYWGLQPLLTVERIRRRGRRRMMENQTRAYLHEFPATLKRAIATTQVVIMNRRPRDIPCLTYSLSPLALIAQSLKPLAEFMSPIAEAGKEIEQILRTLCDLYIFCFENLHPFAEPYDITMYAAMVQSDPIPVAHFQTLNRLWVEAGKIGFSQHPLGVGFLTDLAVIPRFQGSSNCKEKLLHPNRWLCARSARMRRGMKRPQRTFTICRSTEDGF